MHTHEFLFQVLSKFNSTGVSVIAPDEVGSLKDTVMVPTGGTATIRMRFNRVGHFVVHCHILGEPRPLPLSAIDQLF